MKIILVCVLVAIVVVVVLLFTPLGERPLSALFSVDDFQTVDFEGIQLTDKPNQFLICPPDLCRGHAEIPAFEFSVEDLRERWQDIVAASPRLEVLAENGQQIDYVQRSARFRFPDIVTVRFIAVSPAQSTLAIYSRSVYGESDFGVNRKRVEAWLSALGGLGLGTYRMGEDHARRAKEVAALKLGLDLGMTLIDTAEMYGSGGAEEVTGEAVKGRRDDVFIVTKVLPHNASRRGTIEAAERSLRRLGTERIDLYLLHWQGSHPMQETLEAFQQLVHEQKILYYGVSNLDVRAMEKAESLPGGVGVAANQVLYNLNQRGIEWDLLPWCSERQVAVMAYSPLDEGRLVRRPSLSEVARRHGASEECVALAWTLRQPWVVSIPKASSLEHVRANCEATSLKLSDEDLADLDRDYPAPTGRTRLVIT
jgi:diketogulonate reductase-like aldo/keto reductase